MPEYSKEFIIEKARKIKAQSFDKSHSHNFKKGRDYNKYILEISSPKPSQLRPDLLEKTIKNKIEDGITWMKDFINEYWPEKDDTGKYIKSKFLKVEKKE